MADAEVQLQPDSTGKQIDNTTVPTGAGTVYRQRVSIGDAALNQSVAVSAAGAMKVDGSAANQPVSLTAIPNPANLDVLLSTRTKPSDQQHVLLDSGSSVIGHVLVDSGTLGVSQSSTPWVVDGSGVTQPVSVAGTVAVSGTVAISGEALESLRTQRISLGRSVLRPRAAKLRRIGLHA